MIGPEGIDAVMGLTDMTLCGCFRVVNSVA